MSTYPLPAIYRPAVWVALYRALLSALVSAEANRPHAAKALWNFVARNATSGEMRSIVAQINAAGGPNNAAANAYGQRAVRRALAWHVAETAQQRRDMIRAAQQRTIMVRKATTADLARLAA